MTMAAESAVRHRIVQVGCGAYTYDAMRKRKPVEHEYLIIRVRSSGQFVGVVKAIDEEAAKLTALATFHIRLTDRIIAVRRE